MHCTLPEHATCRLIERLCLQVKFHAERAICSHGVPDVLMINLGNLPNSWGRYKAPGASPLPKEGQSSDIDTTHTTTANSCATIKPFSGGLRVWETPSGDWSRMMGDVCGFAHLTRRFLPRMVEENSGTVVALVRACSAAHRRNACVGTRVSIYV